MIAYNVLRRQMKYMAQRAKVSPFEDQVPYCIYCPFLIYSDSTLLASAGNLPKHLESLIEKSDRYVLPERRMRS